MPRMPRTPLGAFSRCNPKRLTAYVRGNFLVRSRGARVTAYLRELDIPQEEEPWFAILARFYLK